MHEFLCCHKTTFSPTHPWRCKLLLVVHFFQTSMFFLMVPSPLQNTEQTAAPVRHIPTLACGSETIRDPRHFSQGKNIWQELSKRQASADCLHQCCLPLRLHCSFPPPPLPMFCLAGPPGFSTTAGQTHTAFANKYSSAWVKMTLDLKRRRMLHH